MRIGPIKDIGGSGKNLTPYPSPMERGM